jgi:reactive intermediate/imine deaminase
MMRALPFLLLAALSAVAAAPNDPKAIFPPGVKPVGPYSPGIAAGPYVYVSGQGARDASNNLPEGIDAQIKQCLENVRAILSQEKLGMQHVVSTQVFLADMKNYEALNRIWPTYFPKDPPTRSVVGVTRMPTGTPVEINAVALRNLGKKKVLRVPNARITEPVAAAISTGDRVYLSGGVGRDLTGMVPKDSRSQLKIVVDGAEAALKLAGLQMRNLVYANIYVSPGTPLEELATLLDEYLPDETARTIVQTSSLPFGANIQIAGVAAGKVERIGGHCALISETVYCSGRVGTIRQALDSLKADIGVGKVGMDRVVAANVYVDDLDEFAAMNKVYATFFGKDAPTRTTVQPWKAVPELSLPPTTGAAPEKDDSPRALVSIVAVR